MQVTSHVVVCDLSSESEESCSFNRNLCIVWVESSVLLVFVFPCAGSSLGLSLFLLGRNSAKVSSSSWSSEPDSLEPDSSLLSFFFLSHCWVCCCCWSTWLALASVLLLSWLVVWLKNSVSSGVSVCWWSCSLCFCACLCVSSLCLQSVETLSF